ncbi:hypothetical protein PtB15_13B114 [Puccinia triticina]|nr:hypothetical protein PtB15_13B114 [Puccinia triticina]
MTLETPSPSDRSFESGQSTGWNTYLIVRPTHGNLLSVSGGGYWPAPLALLRSQLLASSSFSIPSDTLTVAYLRLEVIQFYTGLSPKNKRILQWLIINNQLKFLRCQELIYQQAFFGLMVKKYSKLFGFGQAYFRDLETNVNWEMPINKHIRQRAEHLHKSF